jgi:hypothetical protein
VAPAFFPYSTLRIPTEIVENIPAALGEDDEMEHQYEAVRDHNMRRLGRQLRDALRTLDALRRLDEARYGGATSTYDFITASLEDAFAEAGSMGIGPAHTMNYDVTRTPEAMHRLSQTVSSIGSN